MYYNGQIVYDLNLKKPVKVGSDPDRDWAWSNIPKRSVHLIRKVNLYFELFLPSSLEEAEDLLAKGRIQPAPLSDTHCWKCMNWISNHKDNQECS